MKKWGRKYYCSAYFVVSGNLFWRWLLKNALEDCTSIPIFSFSTRENNVGWSALLLVSSYWDA